jgi:aspartate-semialdehyde dehydrogenase
MAGHRIAVVGATGAAGEMTLRILEERKFPVRELRAFASERSVGKSVTFAGDSIRVEKVTPEAFRGVEIAFFSAGTAQSKEHAPLAVRAGAVVVDKSNAFRMDPAVPLVVPEINAHAVKGHQGIVASPNCTTVVTVMALAPLHRAARVTRVVATSYQAVSGAGVRGVEELRAQTLAWARGEAITPSFFQHQIAFNLIPHIDKFGPGGYTGEELKLVNEVRKILESPDMPSRPRPCGSRCSRPTRWRSTPRPRRRSRSERARELFGRFPGLRVLDDPEHARYPMPVPSRARTTASSGGSARTCRSERGLNFWVVGDQLRKGAATNAVQIAELLGGATPSR